MNVLIKYDFPNSSSKTVEQVLDDYGITKHYTGFNRIIIALAPSSDPVNFQGSALSLNTPSVVISTPTNEGDMAKVIAPQSGSSWSILVACTV